MNLFGRNLIVDRLVSLLERTGGPETPVGLVPDKMFRHVAAYVTG